jgi:membrane protein DedA with SNARE-associated domain
VQFTDLIPFTPEVGYFGLTIITFFGSLIPFVPVPSFLLLATMSVGDKFDIHILAILAAVTSTVAKQIIFYASYSGRRIINEATRKRMKPFERLVRRYGAAAAFVAAATPVPDDVVYIPLGLAKYNPKRFFLATFAGKIILSYTVVLLSRFFGLSYVEPFIENVQDPATIYIGFAVFAALMTIIIILMLRLNWATILGQVAPWTLKDDGKTSS